jgi:hypothetical protein
LFFFDQNIGYRLREFFRPVGNLWREYIRISIPVLVSDGILALGNNSVAMVIGRMGESFIAANSVTVVTQQLSSVMTQGFSQAGAIVTGYTLGEGDREKAQAHGYAFLGIGFECHDVSHSHRICGGRSFQTDLSPEHSRKEFPLRKLSQQIVASGMFDNCRFSFYNHDTKI